jgi:L-ascorbate metabolism protein UlaG (beta-lactamase superfamily)
MKITWINHSCFQFILSNKVIYTDPYEIPEDNDYVKADIILVSHEHGDHYDSKSIHSLKKESTKIICPETCKEVIEKENATGLKPFETIDVGKLKVQGVPAYNIERKRFHPKKNAWLGYIVDDGTIRVYHAGDTEVIPEMSELKNIQFALLPVGGNQYTMDFAEGVKAAKAIKPSYVIPMHDWGKNLQEFADLMKIEAPEIGVIVLKNNIEREV